MSGTALERLEASSDALIGAIDAGQIDRLEAAVDHYRAALQDVRDAGTLEDEQRLKARVSHMLRLADAAQRRVNFLTDKTNRRLQAVSAARGVPVAGTYARPR